MLTYLMLEGFVKECMKELGRSFQRSVFLQQRTRGCSARTIELLQMMKRCYKMVKRKECVCGRKFEGRGRV